MQHSTRNLASLAVAVAVLMFAGAVPGGQGPERVPTARLVSAPRLEMPGAVDSNNPLVWDLVDGEPRLFAMTSWGGRPSLASGPALDRLSGAVPVTFESHPGHGVWMEAIVVDEGGRWYGYYHHETPADACGRADRFIPRLGAAVSDDRGRTWRDLGIVLAAPPETYACGSSNRFVLGGVGDVSVALDHEARDLYFFFTQYASQPMAQGIAVGRLAWADRDEPVGRVSVWSDGAWLPASETSADEGRSPSWAFPVGTVLVPPARPWHDGNAASDAYWGAAVHWNTYLEQYVMLTNRARDETFNQDGLYVSFSPTLSDPAAWSPPKKVMNGGGWYVQVAGLESDGTDKRAGRRARFFNTGRSEHIIEFER
jgi:hypothetical protein